MRFFYILMFLSLWSLGLFILRNRNRSNLWIGLTVFLGGMASYAFSLHLSIMPYFKDAAWLPEWLSRLLYLSSVAAMSIHYFLLPYVFCLGGLWLNERLTVRLRNAVSILLLPGPIVLFLNHLSAGPWNEFEMSSFRWWDGLYIALGCFFYLLAYAREGREMARGVQLRTLLFPIVMTWAYISDYVGFEYLKFGWWTFELRSNGMWQANFVVILGTVGVVVFFTIRYGFLGIKLRIERDRIDSSIRTLTMGVSILNHSIKNEIQKIDYLAEKSISLLAEGHTDRAAVTIGQVHGLTAHLLDMVNRIKEKADDVVLDEHPEDVKELIDSTISTYPGLMMGNGAVSLSAIYETEGELKCDKVHIREILYNLIRNAMDAMPEGGHIQLKAAVSRLEFRIEVQDNGVGIPAELHVKIFEPFFSTKKNAQNYGLGLSYCSSVMTKHGGRLSILESTPGKGTTFALHFPAARFSPVTPSKNHAPLFHKSSGEGRFSPF